jgi:hypothetical protein
MKDGKYEMVDGQQRSRAIIAFRDGDITDLEHNMFSSLSEEQTEFFEGYHIHVVLLEGMTDLEIEAFYVLVNSAGVRLNRPELKKAEYYNTSFLKLCGLLAASPEFEALQLFTDRSAERMNDIDFVTELCASLIHGVTDKKEKVDELFEADIDLERQDELAKEARRIFALIGRVSAEVPILETRLKQKGDFYTLFYFLHIHSGFSREQLLNVFKFVHAVMPHIRPSQEECDTFKRYALACVSQSNSKDARLERLRIFDDLFHNTGGALTNAQKDVLQYLETQEGCRVNETNVGDCRMLAVAKERQ